MNKLDKILFTTLLTSVILIAIGRSPPPQAGSITSNFPSIYLAQKQTKGFARK